MRVESLHVYPVKSCRGIALDRAIVGPRGIEHDRRWMIVDEEAVFVTQREVPMLARVDVGVGDGQLTLSAEGHGAVVVPTVPQEGAPRRRVRVWSSEVDAVDCGDEAARWLGSWLGAYARLVFMPDDTERAVSPEHSRPGDLVGFADGFPLLLASTASLAELNTRLPTPIPVARFRPNIVVTGHGAWDEDAWTQVAIGELALRVAKPCGRCTIITIDQQTGERTGVEPLRTLSTYRKRESNVIFGQNLIPDGSGLVSIGDELRVVARRVRGWS